MQTIMHRRIFSSTLLAGAIAVCVVGCSPKNEFVEPPPPDVTVQKPLKQDVTVYLGIPGRVQAKESTDIRARVNGYLRSVDFIDGKVVQEGQQLFVIEPEPFEAALKAAKANLEHAEANMDIAETEYKRREQAFETRAISEIDVERAKADFAAAKAVVLASEAAVAQADLDLSYTTNTAPITGRIARKLVDVGNLVGGTEPTILTTIVADDPIHVYFSISERLLVDVLARNRRRMDEPGEQSPPVRLELADGSRYALEGLLDYLDNVVNPKTGTITVRAIFENKEALLIPGMYGKILIPQDHPDAILVPDLSIQRDIGGTYVLVVDGEGTVSSKYVTLGAKVDEGRIIEDGLDGSERVIVNGIQRARPGIKVNASTEATPKPVPDEVIQEQ